MTDDIAKNWANFGIFVAKIEFWTTFLVTFLYLKSLISDSPIFMLVSSPIFGKNT